MDFIPGFCRVWARKTQGKDQYWFKLPYAPRGYTECADLVEYYEDSYGSFYQYAITADSDLCRPLTKVNAG